MTITVKNIVPRKLAEDVSTTQYTANNCKCLIDKFTVTNVSASNVEFNVFLVAVGDAPNDANLVLDTRVLAPTETYLCPELVGQALEAGGYISTLAGAANSLTISATGREIT